MRYQLKYYLFILLCFLAIATWAQTQEGEVKDGIVYYKKNNSFESVEGYIKAYSRERYIQGVYSYQKSLELFKDGRFDSCIEELKIFTQLYPYHPETVHALQLLSKAYIKSDDVEKSIQVDYRIYKENPTTEDGLIAYLDAGKKNISIGNKKEGKEILEKVKKQMFSSKVAKDADIELRQLAILDGDLKLPE